MKNTILIFCAFFCLFLKANNLDLTTELYFAPVSPEKKNVNDLIKNQKTQKLFSAKILCLPGAASICSLRNHFEFQSSGFRIQTTPSFRQKGKKTTRINSEIDWNLPEDGPFLASGSESFYEGTVIHCTRGLLPGVFSPLGINQSRDAKQNYISAIQFISQPGKTFSVFRQNSKWEISVKILEDGQLKQQMKAVPEYHRGRFPAKNAEGIKCRMYNHRGITVMNMYLSRQIGRRKNGSPVTEELGLTLCFRSPAAGSTIQLADLTSFCFAENASFSKLPGKGGKQICYQVFLTVK